MRQSGPLEKANSAMTRQEISAELDRVACEWRVTLLELRNPDLQDGVVRAARMAFIRRMHAAKVEAGHTAWALHGGLSTIRRWYRTLNEREKMWWSHEVA